MMDLPACPFDACDQATGQVNSQSLVRYKTNDDSVPVAYGHPLPGSACLNAREGRCLASWLCRSGGHWLWWRCDCPPQPVLGPGGYGLDPVHYLPLLEQKTGALDQAAPLVGWELPEEFATLRRLMEARMIKASRREYVQVLRLLETFEMADLQVAVKNALRMGAIGFDAVKHLVLCQIEKRPPKLDLDVYPYLRKGNVGTTSAASYMSLMKRGKAA
jgi:hypothetical protein